MGWENRMRVTGSTDTKMVVKMDRVGLLVLVTGCLRWPSSDCVMEQLVPRRGEAGSHRPVPGEHCYCRVENHSRIKMMQSKLNATNGEGKI